MKRWNLRILGTVAAVVLTVGCGKNSVNDDAIANDIKAKLYSDATTKPANIDVAVKNGVATLSGDVPSSDVELEAVKVANGASGVTKVNDQMKVNAAAAGGQLPDAGAAQAANTPAPTPAAAPVPPAAPHPEATEPRRHEHSDRNDRAADSGSARSVERTVPSGTRVSVRMVDGIDSKQNTPGQTFAATLDSPLVVGDRVVIPAGAPASVELVSDTQAGRIKGRSEVSVRLVSVKGYQVDTGTVEQAGGSRGKQTAIRTGIGAAAGAIIGGLAGGGKGAAIGSAAGGGAGLGYNLFTHGAQVKIPSETVLTFRLQAPLTVR